MYKHLTDITNLLQHTHVPLLHLQQRLQNLQYPHSFYMSHYTIHTPLPHVQAYSHTHMHPTEFTLHLQHPHALYKIFTHFSQVYENSFPASTPSPVVVHYTTIYAYLPQLQVPHSARCHTPYLYVVQSIISFTTISGFQGNHSRGDG